MIWCPPGTLCFCSFFFLCYGPDLHSCVLCACVFQLKRSHNLHWLLNSYWGHKKKKNLVLTKCPGRRGIAWRDPGSMCRPGNRLDGWAMASGIWLEPCAGPAERGHGSWSGQGCCYPLAVGGQRGQKGRGAPGQRVS